MIKGCSHPSHEHSAFCLSIEREFGVMRELSHPSIVRSGKIVRQQEVQTDNTMVRCYFTMPHYEQDLYHYQQKVFPHVDVKRIKSIFSQIGQALAFLHCEQGRGHFDIKPENIVLQKDRAYLIDFEFSHHIDEIDEAVARSILENRCLAFLPPEIYRLVNKLKKTPDAHLKPRKIAWEAFDVFSLGATIFCTLFFTSPFEKEKASRSDPMYSFLYKNDTEGFWNYNPQVVQMRKKIAQATSPDYVYQLEELLVAMLQYSPKDRITIK